MDLTREFLEKVEEMVQPQTLTKGSVQKDPFPRKEDRTHHHGSAEDVAGRRDGVLFRGGAKMLNTKRHPRRNLPPALPRAAWMTL